MPTIAVPSRDEIANRLMHDARWLWRGVVAIFEKQTADEQNTESTSHNNRVGFNANDAKFLSSLAKQILDWRRGGSKYPYPLSIKQTEIARSKMQKYAGQLHRIALEKANRTQGKSSETHPDDEPATYGYHTGDNRPVQDEDEIDSHVIEQEQEELWSQEDQWLDGSYEE